MKKLYLLLLTSLFALTGLAQNNTSNMKLIFNADGSISPPYILPLPTTLESRIAELADSSVLLFNININLWGNWPGSGFFKHITKFRFQGYSDIGIDSGLVLSTGRLNSDTFWFGSISPGIARPAIYHSTGPNPGFLNANGPETAISRF